MPYNRWCDTRVNQPWCPGGNGENELLLGKLPAGRTAKPLLPVCLRAARLCRMASPRRLDLRPLLVCPPPCHVSLPGSPWDSRATALSPTPPMPEEQPSAMPLTTQMRPRVPGNPGARRTCELSAPAVAPRPR